MLRNRSVPTETVLPHIFYRDVAEALAWLTTTFGFTEHYRYGDEGQISGAQMHLGDAWIMLTRARAGAASPAQIGHRTQSLTVFVADVDGHFARAKAAGARIVEDLQETVYGERQYGVEDLDAHRWLFSTHVRDVSPDEWGATIARPGGATALRVAGRSQAREATPLRLSRSDPIAAALAEAIRTGDLAALHRLLAEHPGLAAARIETEGGSARTPLHDATDWPGHFPNGAAVVAALIAAGADPNAPITGSWHAETPLHWAASSDDVDVADALIAGGADVEAPGASIGGGTPLDDAVGYGQWQVARLLVERGAEVTKLWHAAALGSMACVEAHFAGPTPPPADEVNHAFWQACHGGQRRAAAYLLAHGADLNWVPDYSKTTTALDVAASVDSRREALVSWLRDQGAREASA